MKGGQISDSDDVMVGPQAKGDFELRMNYALNLWFLHSPPSLPLPLPISPSPTIPLPGSLQFTLNIQGAAITHSIALE